MGGRGRGDGIGKWGRRRGKGGEGRRKRGVERRKSSRKRKDNRKRKQKRRRLLSLSDGMREGKVTGGKDIGPVA